MKKILFTVFLIHSLTFVSAQDVKKDTLKPLLMEEVIVIGKKAQITDKQAKTLTSIDDYLQKSAKVDMIKRGAYAWEPIINSMPTNFGNY
jgi:iron complex outermembrane receptor protein